MSNCAELLRDYQTDVQERGRRHIAAGRRRGIIQAATGAGKTYIQASMAATCMAKGRRCLTLADRRRLVRQIGGTFDVFGVQYGVIMADASEHTHRQVIACSRDTLKSWVNNGLTVAPFDLIQIDEAHKSMGDTYQDLLKLFPNAAVVGFTATPARGDGRALGSYYQWLECAVPPSQLVREGWLVKPEVYAPLELAATRKKGQDTRGLAGDPVTHWRRHAEGLPTIAFAANVSESLALRDRFLEAGITAEHIDGTADDEEREGCYTRLQDGTTRILCSVKLLIEGVDFPGVSAAILWAKFGSVIEYLQACGRIMRPAPGKTRAVVLDHSGAAGVHGLPGDDVEWSLDDGTTVDDRRKKALEEGRIAKPVICAACGFVFTAEPACPSCGWKPRKQPSQRKARQIHEARDEVLGRYDSGASGQVQAEARQRYWIKCLYVAAARGALLGSAARMFSSKFQVPPWQAGVSPLPEGRDDWRRPAVDVFPSFQRRQHEHH